jgi:hypothetical protein
MVRFFEFFLIGARWIAFRRSASEEISSERPSSSLALNVTCWRGWPGNLVAAIALRSSSEDRSTFFSLNVVFSSLSFN